MDLKVKFKEWACSFSGCEGGNPNAKIWFCGMEPGLKEGDEVDYYNSLIEEINNGPVKQNSLSKYPWGAKYRYNRQALKLYLALMDQDKNKEKDIHNWRDLVNNLDGSELFKLNLYPVAFPDLEKGPSFWEQYGLYEITGFDSKSLYEFWCSENRFKMFSELVKECSPEIIIGTGIDKGFPEIFHKAFSHSSNLETSDLIERAVEINEKNNKTKKIRYYCSNIINKDSGEATLFVIMPHISQGLAFNSFNSLIGMSKEICSMLNNPEITKNDLGTST